MPLTATEYQRRYRAKRLNTDPEEFRAQRAAYAKGWRNKNKKHSKSYMADYFHYWLSNPINMASHRARTLLSSMKEHLHRNQGVVKFRTRNKVIYKNLCDAGWSWSDSSQCVNHRISIYYFYNFNSKIPLEIIYDVDNLEIITREENSSVLKRTVTQETIELAKQLTMKYPKQLHGFVEYLHKHLGEIK